MRDTYWNDWLSFLWRMAPVIICMEMIRLFVHFITDKHFDIKLITTHIATIYSIIYLYMMHDIQMIFPILIALVNFILSRYSYSKITDLIFIILNTILLGCFSWYTWKLADFRPYHSNYQQAKWHSLYRYSFLYYISYYFDVKEEEAKGPILYDLQEFFIYIFYPPTYNTGPVHFFKNFKKKIK
jgi:hypothetical protein